MATEQEMQAAVREDQGPDLAEAAPKSASYRNQFGRFAKPVAPEAIRREQEMMAAQIAEEARNPTLRPRLQLTSPAKYLFRSDPEHRCVAIRIQGVPQCRDEKHQAFFERKYQKKYTTTERKKHERLAEAVGGLTLTFTPIANKQECYYETDDKLIADFIRGEMAAGRLPQVYEDATARAAEEALPTHRAQAAMRLRLLQQERDLAATETDG